MNKFEPTAEDIKKPEAQENLESLKGVENPEELRKQMMSKAEKETDQFKKECADDLVQIEARAEKDGLVVDGVDKEELQTLNNEVITAKEELFQEIAAEKFLLSESKTSPDFSKSLEAEISAIKSIEELQSYIKNIGSITAADGYVYKEKELAELISGVSDGKLDVRYITRAYGLRDKVYELISTKELDEPIKEQLHEATNEASKENGSENFSEILVGSDIEKVLDQCQSPEARQKAIDLSTILATHIDADPKEISAMVHVLEKVDFNLNSAEEFNSEFLANVLIGVEENVNGISFDSSIDSALKNTLKIFEKQQGVYYHGTNAAAWEDITKSGEIKGENRGFEDDLDEINKIVEGAGFAGNTEFLGWYKINSSDKIFVSGKCDGVNGVNQYAKNSPEWLNVMTNGAFSRRDYDEARKIVSEKISQWQNRSQEILDAGRRNISEAEADTIMQTFEKYWNKYGNADPIVLKITNQEEKVMPVYGLAREVALYLKVNGKNVDYNPEDLLPEENEQFIKENMAPAELRKVIIQFLNYKRSQIDERVSNKSISIKDVVHFALPK